MVLVFTALLYEVLSEAGSIFRLTKVATYIVVYLWTDKLDGSCDETDRVKMKNNYA